MNTNGLRWAAWMLAGMLWVHVAVGEERWQPIGPEGGDIGLLRISPVDANRLYAGTVKGGLYTSHDGGQRWRPIRSAMRGHNPTVLETDPLDGTVVFIGTDRGVYRSFDGGGYWVPVLPDHAVADLATVAKDGATWLYAATNRGLWLSRDRGDHWTEEPLPDPNAQGAQALFASSDFLLVALPRADRPGTALWQRTGLEGAWREIPGGFPVFLALRRVHDGTLYGVAGALFRSTDQGQTWTRTFLDEDRANITVFTENPLHPGHFYAGGIGIGVRANQGEGWQAFGVGLETQQVKALVLNPETGKPWLAGTGQGIFRHHPDSDQWLPSQTGLLATEIAQLVRDPSAPEILYSASLVRGVQRYAPGQGWTTLPLPMLNASASTLAIAPNDHQLLLVGTHFHGLLRSADGGQTWTAPASGPQPETRQLLFGESQTVYAATLDGLYQSSDRGENWQRDTRLDHPLHSLARHPEQTDTLLAGAEFGIYQRQGETWSPLGNGLAVRGPVTLIRFAPDNPDTIYAAAGLSGLFASQDAGQTWQALGPPGLIVSDLAFHPANPALVFISVPGEGVMRLDSDRVWRKVAPDSLNPEVITLLASTSEPLQLFAGTNAGVYQLDTTQLADWSITTDQLQALDADELAALPTETFAALRATDSARIPAAAWRDARPEQLAALPPEAFGALSPDQIRALPPQALTGLTENNATSLRGEAIAAFTPEQVARFDPVEFRHIPPIQMAKILTNLDASQVPPALIEPLLPPGWRLDQVSGLLTAPPCTQLTFKTMPLRNLPANLQILAEPPDLTSRFGLGGQGEDYNLLEEFRDTLRVVQVEGVELAQQEDGMLTARLPNGGEMAFLPAPDGASQEGEAQPTGLAFDAGQLQLDSPRHRRFTLLPAPRDLRALAEVVAGQVTLGRHGEAVIELPASNRRADRRLHAAVVFDAVATPSDRPPGVYLSQSADHGTVVYPDQQAQRIYPAIHERDTFRRLALAFPGVENLEFIPNGAAQVTFSGQSLLLRPTFNSQSRPLATDETVEPRLEIRDALTLGYTVVTQGSALTTEIVVEPR